MGWREDTLERLVERAVEVFFQEELPHLGQSLYNLRRVDAEVIHRHVRTLIKLMLLRDPGLPRYSRVRTPLMRVEWQAEEILNSRWKPHNRLKANRIKRGQP